MKTTPAVKPQHTLTPIQLRRGFICENYAYEDGERCYLPASVKINGEKLCSIHAEEAIAQAEGK